jgi:UDP-N-acetylmuramate--alanine ligase
MTGLPFDIGTTHFVGIGGIGMSGIAELMHRQGHRVQGSDQAAGANVLRLRDMGIEVAVGHAAENIAGASAVVVSSAVTMDNPELRAASEQGIPVLRRADMLAELMRFGWCVSIAGTHGKTTTTALVGGLLDAGGLDPTIVNGGIMNAYGSNARMGGGQWVVAEADESDGTFVRLPSVVSVITNIDPEHLDHYGSQQALEDAFVQFAQNVPYYGAVVVNSDHPGVQKILHRLTHCRVVTFGFEEGAELRAVNLRYEDGVACFDAETPDGALGGVTLPLVGRHNVLNALASIGVARQAGLSSDDILMGLAGAQGVQRRFTHVGTVSDVHIIDDYAHHPVEIAAVLKAAREAYQGRIIAAVQPHRYTRLRDLFDDFCTCFGDADAVVVTDVFAAGEAPIEGFDADSLAAGIVENHGVPVARVADEAALAASLATDVQSGDVIICLGAGSISTWSRGLPERLQALLGGQSVGGGAS